MRGMVLLEHLYLVEPSNDYQVEYLDMINEWKSTGEKMVPFTLRFDCSDFDTFLLELQYQKEGLLQNENAANNSTFWLVNADRRALGAVNIRHYLTPSLLEMGGHIGYGIRPSERKKGYATRLLSLALIKAKVMNIDRVLLSCDKDNIGSAKTMINNGGVLDSEAIVNGLEIQRYWIEIR